MLYRSRSRVKRVKKDIIQPALRKIDYSCGRTTISWMNNLSSRRTRARKNKPAPDLLRSRFICLITTMWQRQCTDCRFYRGRHTGRIIQRKYFRRWLSRVRAPRISLTVELFAPAILRRQNGLFTIGLIEFIKSAKVLENSKNGMEVKRYRRTTSSTTCIYRQCKCRNRSVSLRYLRDSKCRC